MDDPDSTSTYAILFVLLVLSATFSATETALLRLKARRAARPSPVDGMPWHLASLLDEGSETISTLLLSNTAVNVAFATIFTAFLIARSGHALARHTLELVATLVSTALILFWGEVLPKTAANRNPESLARPLSAPVYYLGRVLRPAVLALDGLAHYLLRIAGWRPAGTAFAITTDTVEVAVELGMEQGTLEEEERSMILGALDSSETKVREIMTPRPDVTALDAGATASEIMDAVESTGYSRIPVYDGTIDNIIGAAYAKDMLRLVRARDMDRTVKDLLRMPLFVPETKRLPELLREMKARKSHLAVVLDEYGGTAGIVTLEDVIEEIVGEIADEFDRLEEGSVTLDKGYILPARTGIEDANEELGLDLPVPEDVDSVGGLVYSLADRVPRAGETVRAGDWLLTVAEVKGSRLLKVRVERAPARAADEEQVGIAGAEAR